MQTRQLRDQEGGYWSLWAGGRREEGVINLLMCATEQVCNHSTPGGVRLSFLPEGPRDPTQDQPDKAVHNVLCYNDCDIIKWQELFSAPLWL